VSERILTGTPPLDIGALVAELAELRDLKNRVVDELEKAGVPPTNVDDLEMFADERVRWLREQVGKHMQDVADVQGDLERMTAARNEACEIAETLSSYVPKFPAEGGPTMTDKRIAELRKVGA
jgi:hypothetical protein